VEEEEKEEEEEEEEEEAHESFGLPSKKSGVFGFRRRREIP
jgi:ribosomal protein L12E/L44/L45/RPP1/RPP2